MHEYRRVHHAEVEFLRAALGWLSGTEEVDGVCGGGWLIERNFAGRFALAFERVAFVPYDTHWLGASTPTDRLVLYPFRRTLSATACGNTNFSRAAASRRA
jgi:hypothetical protein